MKKEYLLSQGEKTHTKKSARVPKLRNHIIFVTIFSPIDFKKRLNRKDTDESFHLLTTQDTVKYSTKGT
jgi:hypothetical protein